MLRAIVIFVLIAGSAAFAFAAGQTGDPRYLVKAWIQKFDKSFEHATGWCGSDDICTLKVGEHEVRLRFFLTGDSYSLSVQADADDPAACCVFADKTEEAFISGGSPHAEVLYYRLPAELADKSHVEFGTIYIALENLR